MYSVYSAFLCNTVSLMSVLFVLLSYLNLSIVFRCPYNSPPNLSITSTTYVNKYIII